MVSSGVSVPVGGVVPFGVSVSVGGVVSLSGSSRLLKSSFVPTEKWSVSSL